MIEADILAVGGLPSLPPQVPLALKKGVRRGLCPHIEMPGPEGNEVVRPGHCQQHQQDTPVQPNRRGPIEHHADEVQQPRFQMPEHPFHTHVIAA